MPGRVIPIQALDVLREQAAELAAFKRIPGESGYAAARHTAVQAEIEAALAARLRCKPCPFCGGPLAQRPTTGVLECVDCCATALRGRV
jgi:ribosomal protein L37AE/L43A